MLADLTLADALDVCSRMRPADWACVRAFMGDLSAEEFAINRFQTHGPAWAVYEAGKPEAIGGMAFPNAWTGILWLVATPDLSLHSWRKVLRTARSLLASCGDPSFRLYRHRLEAHVACGWPDAGRFAQRLGMQLEGRRIGIGRRGESVDVWVRVGPPKQEQT